MNTFTFYGKQYEYLIHPYNRTAENPRCVEVPLALAVARMGKRVLEVGNVLGHYVKHDWNVIDLREKDATINADVMEWEPQQQYDTVVSVSTVEHIGVIGYAGQQKAHDPHAVIERLFSYVAPGGVLFITVPIGYNGGVDNLLHSRYLQTTLFMCRMPGDILEWRECTEYTALRAEFKKYASAIAIIELHKPMIKILNLGCGKKPIESAVNHDLRKHHDYIDIAHDLDVMPWPWESATFDQVVALSVFEHLRQTLFETLNEVWRILKPGGRLIVKVPHWKHDNAYADPTHIWRGWSLRAFDVFDPTTKAGREYSFYTGNKWRITQKPKLNRAKSSIWVKMEKRA